MKPKRIIRRSSVKVRTEGENFDLLKAELTVAFAATDSAYQQLDADTVIRRNSRQIGMNIL